GSLAAETSRNLRHVMSGCICGGTCIAAQTSVEWCWLRSRFAHEGVAGARAAASSARGKLVSFWNCTLMATAIGPVDSGYLGDFAYSRHGYLLLFRLGRSVDVDNRRGSP